jgi:pilus assembly protein TadC
MGSFLIALFLFIGLLLILRFILLRGEERSETEAELKIKDILSRNELQAPKGSEEEKEEKKESLPIINRLAWSLKNSASFQNEEGKSFLSRLDMNLVRAGLREKYTPEQALSLAIVIWVLGFVVAVSSITVVGLPRLFGAVFLILFFIYPFNKLQSTIRERNYKIAAEIPFFIQQLYMAISSGNTNIDGAIKRVSLNSERDGFDSILAKEFNQAQIEYSLGAKTTEEALRDIGYRTGVTSVENLCEALIQGLKTGTPIQETLSEYSAQAQEMWRQDMRNFKNKKEPLVTIGVVIAMFGAFIIMIAPILIGLLDTLTGF